MRLFEGYWKETNPDMVVSFVPHFNRALGESFSNVFPGRPFVTILTDIADYPPHFWIEQRPQYFICGSDRAIFQARSTGHPDNRIFRASGMILHPRFYDSPAETVPRNASASDSAPIWRQVLFSSAAMARRRCSKLPSTLEQSRLDLQLIFVCGKNDKLASALRAQKSRHPRFVEGFTTQVNRYMQLADFFIGKPGPGSVSEALAMHLPVIVECNAWTLPQERYNADWILEKEVGVVLPNFRKIGGAAAQMIEPRRWLAIGRMRPRSKIARFSRFRACSRGFSKKRALANPPTAPLCRRTFRSLRFENSEPDCDQIARTSSNSYLELSHFHRARLLVESVAISK